MQKSRMTTFAVLFASGLVAASLALNHRQARADEDPNGEWTLTQVVEDDLSSHAPPAFLVSTYTVDTVAHTVVNKVSWQGSSVPFTTVTFNYTVTQAGHWYIANAGPGGRSIEFTVACSSSTLTLTRVAYSGPACVVAPAPAYPDGGTAPPPPSTIPQPGQFILSR